MFIRANNLLVMHYFEKKRGTINKSETYKTPAGIRNDRESLAECGRSLPFFALFHEEHQGDKDKGHHREGIKDIIE